MFNPSGLHAPGLCFYYSIAGKVSYIRKGKTGTITDTTTLLTCDILDLLHSFFADPDDINMTHMLHQNNSNILMPPYFLLHINNILYICIVYAICVKFFYNFWVELIIEGTPLSLI